MTMRVSGSAVKVWIAWPGSQFDSSERRQHMNAILLASAGVAILLVGGGVGFWLGRSGIGGGKARVEKAEAELEDYKRSVTEHFGQTAAHFQAIGKQYRELYEHMANGAQSLCEPDDAGKTLLFAPRENAPSNNPEDASAEAAVEAEMQPPMDYAEEPVAEDATEARETSGEPVDQQQTELVKEAESANTDVAEGSDSEKAAEPQPESKVESGERTIH